MERAIRSTDHVLALALPSSAAGQRRMIAALAAEGRLRADGEGFVFVNGDTPLVLTDASRAALEKAQVRRARRAAKHQGG